ncbi:MAG: hypothetical protein AAGE52_40535 [Myxococcota bacterium]
MRSSSVALLLLLTACRSEPPAGGGHEGGEEIATSEGLEAETPGERAAGECPARYNEDPPRCEGDDFPEQCSYPEGDCHCGVPPHCGGAARPPLPLRWMCEARRPPCPRDGTPCGDEGARCSHDACGWTGVRCVDGTWQSFQSPPPP